MTALAIVYLIAITAEAMSGALAAGRRSMDIFGVVVIAFVPPPSAVTKAMTTTPKMSMLRRPAASAPDIASAVMAIR